MSTFHFPYPTARTQIFNPDGKMLIVRALEGSVSYILIWEGKSRTGKGWTWLYIRDIEYHMFQEFRDNETFWERWFSIG
jgi:hypothetical protein